MVNSHVLSGPDTSCIQSVSPAPEFVADPELAEALEACSTAFVPNEDHVLFRQGEVPAALCFVKKGCAALAMESHDRIVMCVQAGPGSLVGLPAVVGNKPYTMTAAPCADAVILQVSRQSFELLLAESPALAMKVLQVLAAEIRLARNAMMHLAA